MKRRTFFGTIGAASAASAASKSGGEMGEDYYDKLGVISGLIDRVDALLIGGAMAFTFLAAEGAEVGRSLVEEDRFDDVRQASLLVDPVQTA